MGPEKQDPAFLLARVRLNSYQVDLGVSVPLTRHIHTFDIPLSPSTESSLRNPDKEQLRADILILLQKGMSYRQIGIVLGIHWTRVGQIFKSAQ
jgi:hypothetical protein